MMTRATVAQALSGAFFLANSAFPAMADCTSQGDPLPGTGTPSITSLLNPGGGVYACYNPGSGRENNETLLGGSAVQDYKLGPTDPKDPSTVVASYTIGANSITYNYGSSTDTYQICATPISANIYEFFNTGTNASISIVISSGPGTC